MGVDDSGIPHLNLACKSADGPPLAADIELSKLSLLFSKEKPADFPRNLELNSRRNSPYLDTCCSDTLLADSLSSVCQCIVPVPKMNDNAVLSERKVVVNFTEQNPQFGCGFNNIEVTFDANLLRGVMAEMNIEDIVGNNNKQKDIVGMNIKD